MTANGPAGATHLILCTGVAELISGNHETYTFLVGSQLSRRQFVGVIASGALSTIQTYDTDSIEKNAEVELKADLVLIDASFDEDSGQVKVSAEVSSGIAMAKVAISYNVSILAELPIL